jgi:V/A-type H+-transporting ATPase subunit E
MNGYDKICARVIAEGTKEAENIINTAEEKAAQLRQKADAEAEALYNKLVSEGEAEAVRKAGLIINSAETDMKKSLLSMKQDTIAKAFDLALDKLLKLEKREYVALLARLAAAASETKAEELILNEGDAKSIGSELIEEVNSLIGGNLSLSAEHRKIKGGFILSQDRIEVNCALETLIALKKNELAGQVAELLFA